MSITTLSQSANMHELHRALDRGFRAVQGTWDVLSEVPVSNEAKTMGNHLQNCLIRPLCSKIFYLGIKFGPLLFMSLKVDTKHKISLGVSGPLNWIEGTD